MPKRSRSTTRKAAAEAPKQCKVSGQVFNSSGESIMGQEVLAVDVDLRGAAVYQAASSVTQLKANGGFEFLGRAETNVDGYYEVAFGKEQFQRNELGLADVIVFAVDGDAIAARSQVATQTDYANNELTHWDIRLPDISKRGVPEYTRLIRVLEPFVKESGLQLFQLGSSDDQINFLAAETQQDQTHTSLAVQADKLRSDYPKYKLSTELFYGIGRQNITLSWLSLLQQTVSSLGSAIKQSIAQNIISSQDARVIEGFLKNVLELTLQHSTTAPESADFYKIIGLSVKDKALQSSFAQAYLQSNGAPEDFWKGLSQKRGFTPETIRRLQLTNQLSILSGQHTALIAALLRDKRGFKDPSDLLGLRTEDWATIINDTGVPESVPGDTFEDKAKAYIAGIQTVLNAAYPTQKIASMIDELSLGDSNVKDKVAAFFASATSLGFDISTSRVTDFSGKINEVADDLSNQVVQKIELLQRIYQISPTPEAMSTLIAKGYTSAYHVSSLSQNSFIAREAVDLGGVDVALSVYNRARHQVMRAQHIVLKLRDAQDPATPSRIITSDQQKAIRDYIATLSTK